MENILAKALGQDAAHLAAEEKQQLLGRLLARFAHEIRNPLSSLDIHVQLLEEDLAGMHPGAKEKLAGRFEIIHGELHRLENIVKQFLRLAGPSALDIRTLRLEAVLERVRDLLQPEAAARKIELSIRSTAGLPEISADEDQLIQALLNLVINAVQAVDSRGCVELRTELGPESILIQVQDSGPGVPPDKISAIFEPYFTTKPDGSGIGLWIAQQIITAHGGIIAVANAPQGGAIFTVRLPRKAKTPEGKGCTFAVS